MANIWNDRGDIKWLIHVQVRKNCEYFYYVIKIWKDNNFIIIFYNIFTSLYVGSHYIYVYIKKEILSHKNII